MCLFVCPQAYLRNDTPDLHLIFGVCIRAESVTENRNRYRDILKTETDTDVGIEKTEKNENRRKKYRKNPKIRFLLMTIY